MQNKKSKAAFWRRGTWSFHNMGIGMSQIPTSWTMLQLTNVS